MGTSSVHPGSMTVLVPSRVLFAATMASTVLLNLVAIKPRLSPGNTRYEMRAPIARPVGRGVGVNSGELGAGRMITSPGLIRSRLIPGLRIMILMMALSPNAWALMIEVRVSPDLTV